MYLHEFRLREHDYMLYNLENIVSVEIYENTKRVYVLGVNGEERPFSFDTVEDARGFYADFVSAMVFAGKTRGAKA